MGLPLSRRSFASIKGSDIAARVRDWQAHGKGANTFAWTLRCFHMCSRSRVPCGAWGH